MVSIAFQSKANPILCNNILPILPMTQELQALKHHQNPKIAARSAESPEWGAPTSANGPNGGSYPQGVKD
ncbi:hypothetical protein VE04_09750, partial [Pseudogymnoascus sp. 24MN13]